MNMNKPIPKGHPLHHATKELVAAVDAYMKLRSLHLGEFSEFEAAWSDFLHRVERVWSKTQGAVHSTPGWKKVETETTALRRSDPLLRYLIHARNAEEHSIQDVAKEWGEINVTNVTATSFTLSWPVYDRPLLAVANRGVIYTPPREHLGASIAHLLGQGVAEPIVVADLALHFYHSLINRVLLEVLATVDDV